MAPSSLVRTLRAAKDANVLAGRGSYGSVHKARDTETNDIVAVKIIPLGDQDEMSDIQKEIEMLQACDHSNIVQYLVRRLPVHPSVGPI